MKREQEVGGLWCRQVLGYLSDYVDEELDERVRHQVETHLEGCDLCERFGGEYAAVVRGVRASLAPAPPLAEPLEKRLRERLRTERGESPS